MPCFLWNWISRWEMEFLLHLNRLPIEFNVFYGGQYLFGSGFYFQNLVSMTKEMVILGKYFGSFPFFSFHFFLFLKIYSGVGMWKHLLCSLVFRCWSSCLLQPDWTVMYCWYLASTAVMNQAAIGIPPYKCFKQCTRTWPENSQYSWGISCLIAISGMYIFPLNPGISLEKSMTYESHFHRLSFKIGRLKV